MTGRKVLIVAITAIFVVSAFAQKAWSIPVFARKYKTSCLTCHSTFPRLNATGEAYRLNGYKFEDDELYRKQEPVELGDEAYKKVWPDAIWPADIPGLPPIAFIITSDYKVDIGGTKDARSEFVFPSGIEILGAGSIGDRMSLFVELGFSKGEGAHHGDEPSEGTETDAEGWFQFEDVFGPENAFNIRVGTVGMHEMGLFTARDHNRFTLNPYLYTSWTMPEVEFHDGGHADEAEEAGHKEEGGHHEEVDAIGFSGNPFIIHAAPGIELNGFGANWRYALGLVNGNGDDVSDNNSDKDGYLQLAFKIGGQSFDGSEIGEKGKLETAESWRDDSLTLSLFGYYGTSPIEVETEGGHLESEDDFWRLGPGFLFKIKDLELDGGYMFGENDVPFGALSGQSVDSEAWFVEASVFAYPWLVPLLRYESLSLDLPSGVEGLDASQDRSRIVVGAKALLRANVSLTAEGRIYTNDERFDEDDNDDELVLSLTAAF